MHNQITDQGPRHPTTWNLLVCHFKWNANDCIYGMSCRPRVSLPFMPPTCLIPADTPGNATQIWIKNRSLKILPASYSSHNKEHERGGETCIRGIGQRRWFQHACSTKIIPKIPKTSGNVMMKMPAHRGFLTTRRKKIILRYDATMLPQVPARSDIWRIGTMLQVLSDVSIGQERCVDDYR